MLTKEDISGNYTPMQMRQKLFDSDVRVGQTIWLPGICCDYDETIQVFQDFVDDDFPETTDHPLIKSLPFLKSFAESDDRPDPGEIAEALRNHGGFLINAETPVQNHKGDGVYTSSWGHCYTCWLYARTEQEIVHVVVQWAEQKAAFDKEIVR